VNRRSDDYAGDLAAPMRFGIEVVRTIRERDPADLGPSPESTTPEPGPS